jgi:hypothetical protein
MWIIEIGMWKYLYDKGLNYVRRNTNAKRSGFRMEN